MKFVTYLDGKTDVAGVLSTDGKWVYSLEQLGYPYHTIQELIEAFTPELKDEISAKMKNYGEGIALSEVKLTAPIPYPKHDVICLGHNYLEHAKESFRFRGEEYVPLKYPTYFGKRVNRAVGHNEPVMAHKDITDMLDYEVELAIVMGKKCDHINEDEVFDYIFGYTILNDISARNLQNNHGGQFFLGKGLDGFTPMGPCIVTVDEFDNPPNLHMTSRVNGEVRQDNATNDFIFDIPFVISELSQGIVLEPGDIIATGTPSGVGMGFQPPKFMKPGDVVECEIEGIGILRNPIE